jgi:hypothetical protein
MIAFFYKPEVQTKEESQRAADVNPLVLAPRLSFFLFLFTAFKPTHCAGWVRFLHSHQSKTRDPWNAVHGL